MRDVRTGSGGLISSWPVRTVELGVNLLVLGILVCVLSVSVVLAIPAWAAAFGVARDWQEFGDSAVLRPFLRHLRACLPLAVLAVPLAVVTVGSWLVAQAVPVMQPVVLRLPVVVVTGSALLVVWCVAVLALPVWARYRVRVRDAVRLATSLGSRRPVVGGVVAAVLLSSMLVGVVVPPAVLIVVGPATYVIHCVVSGALRRDDLEEP